MRNARWPILVMCVLGAAPAAADPQTAPTASPGHAGSAAPADQATPANPAAPADGSDRTDARALMQSGLKLFAAKDFLGALAVFKTAYERFASARILLNIGTTLTRLGRKTEAANIYQRYLDSPDADPARRTEVKRVLAELDATLAIVEVSVTPADAEIQIDEEDWTAASAVAVHRVVPGSVSVRARHAGYYPVEQIVRTTAGARVPVAFSLVEVPAPVAPVPAVAIDGGLAVTGRAAPTRSRIGVMALAHVDFANRGAAARVGATLDVTRRLEVELAALLGGSSGGYAGARYQFLDGKARPLISAGLPIFASGGARVALRGAGGVELAVTRHVALIAELGVEYLLNPEADIKRTSFIPAIGAVGRL